MGKQRAAYILFSLVLASLAAVGGLTLWRLLPAAADPLGQASAGRQSARAGNPDSGSAVSGLPVADIRQAANAGGENADSRGGKAASDFNGDSANSEAATAAGAETPDAGALHALLNGSRSSAFQAVFENKLAIRDFAIQLWGRLRWDLFRQGYSGVLAGQDGWLFSTEEFQADLGYLQGNLTTILADTKAALSGQGIQLLVVPVPPKALVQQQQLKPYRPDPAQESRHKAFLALLQDLDIPSVDLLAVYTNGGSPVGSVGSPESSVGSPEGSRGRSVPASQTETASPEYFMRSDTHWSPLGAALAARAIAELVGSLAGAEAIVHSSFSEEPSEPLSVPGDLLSYLPEGGGWFRGLPPVAEISPLRLKAREGNSAASLFGAQAIPVALVGTSYSASPLWGFENSLKLALAADVLPLAREGQGPFRPMQDALESGHLAANNVRLVIWEIPERYIPFAALP